MEVMTSCRCVVCSEVVIRPYSLVCSIFVNTTLSCSVFVTRCGALAVCFVNSSLITTISPGATESYSFLGQCLDLDEIFVALWDSLASPKALSSSRKLTPLVVSLLKWISEADKPVPLILEFRIVMA